MSHLFYDHPSNPPPDDARGGFLVAPDGTALRYAVFPASARPLKGTVILLQGRNEYIEKYFETARDLCARGFTVATFDLRGQGASDRLLRDPRKGYVESFDDYVADIDQFFRDILVTECRAPFYVVGHSAGALIGLLAAPLMSNRVHRMLLCAPLIGFTGLPVSATAIRRLSAVLTTIGLGSTYMSGGARRGPPVPFSENVLTSDAGRYARNTTLTQTYPQLGLGGPTAAWIHAACVAADTVQTPEFLARIRTPILFVAAGIDTVVSTPAIEHYVRRLKTASLITIDGAKHEIFQEADLYREQIFAAFDAFIPGTDSTAF